MDIDGGTDIGAAIVDADLFIVDDGAGGTNRKVTASRIKTYAGGAALANDGNNRVVTADGSDGINGEANLSFDGSTLAVTGAVTVSGTTTLSDSMTVIDDKGVVFGTGGDWMLAAAAGEGSLDIFRGGTHGASSSEGVIQFIVQDTGSSSLVNMYGPEGGNVGFELYADQGDDDADHYAITGADGIYFASYADGGADNEVFIGDDENRVEDDWTGAGVDYA